MAISEAQIRWLCRRGMKELDVLTERYYTRRWPSASAQERLLFVQLLTAVEDPDIWSWAMGYSDVPAEYQGVIEQLRIHH